MFDLRIFNHLYLIHLYTRTRRNDILHCNLVACGRQGFLKDTSNEHPICASACSIWQTTSCMLRYTGLTAALFYNYSPPLYAVQSGSALYINLVSVSVWSRLPYVHMELNKHLPRGETSYKLRAAKLAFLGNPELIHNIRTSWFIALSHDKTLPDHIPLLSWRKVPTVNVLSAEISTEKGFLLFDVVDARWIHAGPVCDGNTASSMVSNEELSATFQNSQLAIY